MSVWWRTARGVAAALAVLILASILAACGGARTTTPVRRHREAVVGGRTGHATGRSAGTVPSSRSTGESPRSASPSTTAPDGTTLAREFLAFVNSKQYYAGWSAEGEALNVSVQRCMARQGYVWKDPSFPPQPLLPMPWEEGYFALSEREANGYGLYASATAIPDASPPKETNPQLVNDGKPDSLSSASYRCAYFGPPGSDVTYTVPYVGKMEVYGAGCLARATAQLYGSMYDGILTQQLNDIVDASWAHFTRRAAFVTAEEAWSACVKAHGYDVERPGAAWSALASRYDAHGPSLHLEKEGITEAVQDYHCAVATGFATVFDASLMESIADLPAGQRAALRRDIDVSKAMFVRAVRNQY